MSKSNNLYKHVITSLFFLSGLYLSFSGEFILASALFCLAFISSNLGSTGSSFQA